MLTGHGPVKRSDSTDLMAGATMDTGALIAIERGSPRMQALIDEAAAAGVDVAVPAAVLGQAWRGTQRQALLARFFRLANVDVVVLDESAARTAGVLCGRAGSNDIVDASVVVCARLRRHSVVTSDPNDLARLDPELRLLQP